MLIQTNAVQVQAPLAARGFIRFINVRPDGGQEKWICEDCLQHVTRTKMTAHRLDCPGRA